MLDVTKLAAMRPDRHPARTCTGTRSRTSCSRGWRATASTFACRAGAGRHLNEILQHILMSDEEEAMMRDQRASTAGDH